MSVLGKQKPAQAFAWLMTFSVVSKILGFIREIITASLYGVGVLVDAMNVIWTPILFIRSLFAGTAVSSRFVKVFQAAHKDEQGGAEKVLLALSILTFVGALVLNGAVMILSRWLIDYLGGGQLGALTEHSILSLQVAIWASWFVIESVLIQGYLNSFDYFDSAGLQDVVSNIIYIIGTVGVIKYGLLSFSLSIIAANAVRVFIQLPDVFVLLKLNKPDLMVSMRYLKESLGHLADLMWLVLIVLMPNVVSLVMVQTATSLGSGQLSALRYAEKLIAIFQSVVAFPLGFAITPELSRSILGRDTKQFNRILVRSLEAIIILSFPIACYMIAFPDDIVRLILQRGNFDLHAVELTSQALRYYSIGLFFFAPMHIVLQVYFVQSLKVELFVSYFVGSVVNIFLLYVLAPLWGLAGIGIAISAGVFLSLTILLFYLRQRFVFYIIPVLLEAGRILLISGAALGMVWFSGLWLTNTLGIVIKLGVYSAIIVALTAMLHLSSGQLIKEQVLKLFKNRHDIA